MWIWRTVAVWSRTVFGRRNREQSCRQKQQREVSCYSPKAAFLWRKDHRIPNVIWTDQERRALLKSSYSSFWNTLPKWGSYPWGQQRVYWRGTSSARQTWTARRRISCILGRNSRLFKPRLLFPDLLFWSSPQTSFSCTGSETLCSRRPKKEVRFYCK